MILNIFLSSPTISVEIVNFKSNPMVCEHVSSTWEAYYLFLASFFYYWTNPITAIFILYVVSTNSSQLGIRISNFCNAYLPLCGFWNSLCQQHVAHICCFAIQVPPHFISSSGKKEDKSRKCNLFVIFISSARHSYTFSYIL